ncbi:hypothetical protein PDPE_1-02856 [Photobacterium damselae subsp. piscicida]|uniref:Uncharacterized protein n=2 Tax=Photobacterium damsela subsp. piscicida TaxID=38294 RepID=A0AAD1CF39_PHODP|nr:hypothetical protein PDPUS_1_01605 [Photobacterium damselae subsp. piscicida]BBC42015.1 hypothetical protein PDPE_1-02856 [Photobacterium damselae subsp. piscicida]GAW45492.1 hypothetical protein PDPJ_1_02907 [Photobacterium damselae subsp. piscicida]
MMVVNMSRFECLERIVEEYRKKVRDSEFNRQNDSEVAKVLVLLVGNSMFSLADQFADWVNRGGDRAYGGKFFVSKQLMTLLEPVTFRGVTVCRDSIKLFRIS